MSCDSCTTIEEEADCPAYLQENDVYYLTVSYRVDVLEAWKEKTLANHRW